MKKISKIFTLTLIFIAIFVVGALGSYTLLNNYDLSSSKDIKTQFLTLKENMPRAYVVQSGSMEPAIPTGALIFSLPQKNYRAGEILTFEQGNRLITHRAMYQEYTLEDSIFVTKGDANEDPDSQKISQSQVVGKVVFSIPYVGYLADYAKTPQGFILFVIVPATIVIYEELKSLLKELLKFIKRMKNSLSSRAKKDVISSEANAELRNLAERKDQSISDLDLSTRRLGRDDESEEHLDTDIGSFGSKFIKGMAILPIFGAILVVAAFSVSYFFDNEHSLQNVFSASSDFDNNETPTPTPDPNASPTPTPTELPFDGLVINEVLPSTICSVGQTEGQWIELYNGTGQTINPQNLKLTDGVNTISVVNAGNLSMDPGELLLLAHNAAIWGTTPNSCWDNGETLTGNLGGQLDINTGILQLLDSDDNVIDTVRWGAGETHQPTIEQSVERNPKGQDSVYGVDFEDTDFVVRNTPQPGI